MQRPARPPSKRPHSGLALPAILAAAWEFDLRFHWVSLQRRGLDSDEVDGVSDA
jgi:hypothetical protein